MTIPVGDADFHRLMIPCRLPLTAEAERSLWLNRVAVRVALRKRAL
jgi:hypothetical protein